MRLSLKTKMAYGMTAVADQCIFYLYGTFFMFFLTTVAGVSPAIAGIISAIGAVWDALMAPVAGYLSDNTHSKYGKRKPYIMLFAFPMAVFTSLLFTAVGATMWVKVIYYTVVTVIFWTIFPFFFIPFLAWGAELTEDYGERTVLRSFAYVGNTVGLAIGTLLPTIIVDYLMNLGKNQQQAWQGAILIVSVCIFIALFFGPMAIKDRSNALTAEEKRAAKEAKKREKGRMIGKMLDMFRSFGEVLKLAPLRCILIASVLYLIASTVFASDRMYFFTYNMELSAGNITILMAVVTFSGVVFVPLVNATRRYFDKKVQFIAGMSVCAGVMLVSRFTAADSMLAAAVVMVAFGLGNMCYWQLIPAMMYDVCEVDELVSGQQRQGTIVSLQSLAESASEAAAMLFLGFVLELAGFDEALAIQTDTALFWVSNCFTAVPVVFMVLAIILVAKYPVTKKNFDRIVAALEARRAGAEIDLAEFEDITR